MSPLSPLAIISIIVLGLSAIYSLLLLLVLGGLFRLRRGRNQRLHRVSVVVAARDEEGAIGACLKALQSQTYPVDRFEVVVVDDHSVDGTPDVVRRFGRDDDRIRLITTAREHSPLRGKKRALQTGIEHSRGEIILITDADCRPVRTWIETMVRHFEPQVGLVAGHVRQHGERWWHRCRYLERLSMSAVAAGTMAWGYGLTATGGNLGYRKKVFRQVGGFSALARPLSGDDDLFVQLVSRRTSWELRYALEPQAVVETDPPATVRDFLTQERRRTSKGRFYPLGVKVAAVEAFLMNLGLIITVPLALAGAGTGPVPLLAFGLKIICELSLLFKAGRLLNTIKTLRFFPLVAILYPLYFLLFSIWGSLGDYRWKAAAVRPEEAVQRSATT
jgi:cellulose synthase/poly-beta-1,6-N-acetylglucosamine synthase-like glycosyltransferase